MQYDVKSNQRRVRACTSANALRPGASSASTVIRRGSAYDLCMVPPYLEVATANERSPWDSPTRFLEKAYSGIAKTRIARYVSCMLVQGYVRVSTATQVRDGDGLAVQRARIEGWAFYQGLPAPVFGADEGVSGGTVDAREGFKGALRTVLRAAERGEGAVLVVAALDRLGRSMVDALEVAEVLAASGVRLVTLDGIDTASPMGAQSLKALLAVRAMVAELERDAITARLQGGRRHAREHGHVYASEPAYGQRAEGDALVDDIGEQRAIARVRELRAAGASYRTIAATLGAEGIRPRRGTVWSLAMLHKLATGARKPAAKKTSARVARARAALLAEESAA